MKSLFRSSNHQLLKSALIAAACLLMYSVFSAVAPQVHAQTKTAAGNVLFILDGSGSMWGQVEGQHKIVIAKDVMTSLVRKLPDNIRAGLQVYGHRSKGDCNDIELLVPVGAANRQALIERINSIKPKGKTPITKAFEHAVAQLQAMEEETTVVLVSDGKETCEGDPCALVRELRDQGIKLKVHVVGFDVTHDESEQLVCIADAGGGKYFPADNAADLTRALEEVKQEVIVQSQPVASAPAAQTAPASGDGNTLIVGTGTVKLQARLGPDSEPLQRGAAGMWQIFEAEADFEGNRKSIAMHHDAQPVVTLNAGSYKLRVKYGDAAKIVDLLVKTGAPNQGEVVIGAGQVKLQARLGPDSEPLQRGEAGMWQIFEAEADFEGKRKAIAMHHDAQEIVTLNSGSYQLKVKYGDAVKTVDLKVAAGEQKVFDMVIGAGQVKLVARLGPNGELLQRGAAGMWQIFEAEADFEGKRKSIAMHHDAQEIVTLNAGKYLVQLKVGSLKRHATLEVAAGEQKTFAFEPE